MKLETFFEKFEVLAEMPGAVGKLRRLILQFAIAGNLVAQDPNDEPADALLNRIYAESQFDIEPIDPPYQLPSSWRWIRLGMLLPTFQNGASSRGDSDGVPTTVLRLADIDCCRVSLLNTRTIGINQKDLAKYRLMVGDTLVTRVNGSADIVGSFIPIDCDLDAIYCDHFIRMRVNQSAIFPSFISLLGGTSVVRDQIRSAFISTAGQKTVNQRHISALRIPLPPLAEQKRIVSKVDELIALCDRLEAQQQERETRHTALTGASLAQFADAPTPASLQLLFHPSYTITPTELRKAILTLAVQGRLGRVDVENDAQKVGDHIDFKNGYAFKSQWFKPDGVRLCRNMNVSHGTVDWRESVCVNDDVAKQFERFALSEGDIVLSLDRPLITTGLKVARIRKADLPCLLLQRVAKPEPKHDKIDMSYFFLWLNSPEFIDSIDPGRSNGVPHISTKQVQLLSFVLPPLTEQGRIVAKVEQLMSMVDVLEKQLAASRTAEANLLTALLAELD